MGVFSIKDNALKYIEDIKENTKNYNLELFLSEYNENKIFKVLIGPFESIENAKNIADNLLELGYNSIIITNEGQFIMLLIKKIYISLLIVFFNINFLTASNFSSKAKYATVVDLDTGAVLYSKNATSKIYPASMSKLMTLYILFEEIQNGALSLDTNLNVSKKAWKKGSSKMFLEPGKKVTVRDILKGIIVQSGNDACIVVAENISGDEDSFADLMNEKAQELNLQFSNFTNSTGWPDENHYMTVSDLAILSAKVIKDFPEFFHLFKEKSFTYNEISQNNRNPLLFSYKYADGLKTGYTEASGYSLAATALKNNRRLVLVVSGLNNEKERKEETQKLFEWAYKNFMNKII